jgi:hypothetical protein
VISSATSIPGVATESRFGIPLGLSLAGFWSLAGLPTSALEEMERCFSALSRVSGGCNWLSQPKVHYLVFEIRLHTNNETLDSRCKELDDPSHSWKIFTAFIARDQQSRFCPHLNRTPNFKPRFWNKFWEYILLQLSHSVSLNLNITNQYIRDSCHCSHGN